MAPSHLLHSQGMKIEVDFKDGKNSAGIFVHRYLGQSMGTCIAAFAHAVLSGHPEPGVWYPEVRETHAYTA